MAFLLKNNDHITIQYIFDWYLFGGWWVIFSNCQIGSFSYLVSFTPPPTCSRSSSKSPYGDINDDDDSCWCMQENKVYWTEAVWCEALRVYWKWKVATNDNDAKNHPETCPPCSGSQPRWERAAGEPRWLWNKFRWAAALISEVFLHHDHHKPS